MEEGQRMAIDNFYVVLILQSVASFVGAYLGARYLPTLIEGGRCSHCGLAWNVVNVRHI